MSQPSQLHPWTQVLQRALERLSQGGRRAADKYGLSRAVFEDLRHGRVVPIGDDRAKVDLNKLYAIVPEMRRYRHLIGETHNAPRVTLGDMVGAKLEAVVPTEPPKVSVVASPSAPVVGYQRHRHAGMSRRVEILAPMLPPSASVAEPAPIPIAAAAYDATFEDVRRFAGEELGSSGQAAIERAIAATMDPTETLGSMGLLVQPASVPQPRHGVPSIVRWATRLEAARVDAGLTCKDVGDLIDVDPTTISSWETGRSWPIADHHRKLVELFPQLGDVRVAVRDIAKPPGRARQPAPEPTKEAPPMPPPPPKHKPDVRPESDAMVLVRFGRQLERLTAQWNQESLEQLASVLEGADGAGLDLARVAAMFRAELEMRKEGA